MKYAVFYQDTKIGILEINEKGQHKYTPDVVGTEAVKDRIAIFYEMLNKTEWRDPIPFFENRIRDAKKFSSDDVISKQTDSFKMVKSL